MQVAFLLSCYSVHDLSALEGQKSLLWEERSLSCVVVLFAFILSVLPFSRGLHHGLEYGLESMLAAAARISFFFSASFAPCLVC